MKKPGFRHALKNSLLVVATVLACAMVCQAATVSYKIPVLTVKSDADGAVPGSGKLNACPFSYVETTNDFPVKVSIVEDTPAGAGNSLRASLWLAVTTASMTLNRTLAGTIVNFETSGCVDGPSAGGMFCLAVMSAMDGRSFPDDFAMTGTIMSDGTIGPVGGIAEKIKGASKAGVKRICIPSFARMDEDEKRTCSISGRNWASRYIRSPPLPKPTRSFIGFPSGRWRD